MSEKDEKAAAKTTKDDGAVKPTQLNYEGFEFSVDTDIIDDVEVLETIDQIGSGAKPGQMIAFIKQLIGEQGYDKMKAYFVEKDGKFRLTKLTAIVELIFESFDPKGLRS